jgi:hypothetical protein
MEDAPLKAEAAVADSNSPSTTSSQLSHRTKALLAMLGLVALVAVVVVGDSRRSEDAAIFDPYPRCSDYQSGNEWAPYPQDDKDPFDFSVFLYSVGYFYSYKHRITNETKGPRMLVMLDLGPSHSSSHKINGFTTAYRYGATVESGNLTYSLKLTIGKNANDDSTEWYDKKGGNVTIDPSVVHVRFGNKTINTVYNDTVFMVSYMGPNSTLQVEQRRIDLFNVTLSECGVKQLLDENVELSTFYSRYRK